MTRHRITITVEFEADEEVENDADNYYAIRLRNQLEKNLESVIDDMVWYSPLCNAYADMDIQISSGLVL